MNRRIKIEGLKPTKCSKFILPMCNIQSTKLPHNFINAYINDEKSIVLIFEKLDNSDSGPFNKFLQTIVENEYYVKYEEDIDEIVLYFNIPDHYINDFELFKIGAYSKFSEMYKEILILHYGRISIKENHTVSMYNTIYPQEFKRKQIADRLGVDIKLVEEVLDKPDLKQEEYIPIYKLQPIQIEEQLQYDNKQ